MENRYSILSIDDNVIDLILIKNILGDIYNVFTAKNSKEAMQILSGRTVNLILLDMQMSDISGLDFAALLKETTNTANIPVIFVSSYGSDYFKELSKKAGAADYITKPVKTDVLHEKILDILEPRIVVRIKAPIIFAKLDALISACKNKDYVSIITMVNEFRKFNYDKETDEKISELCSAAMRFEFLKTIEYALKLKREGT